MKKTSKTKLKFNTRTVYTYGTSQQRSLDGNDTGTITTTVTTFMPPQKA